VEDAAVKLAQLADEVRTCVRCPQLSALRTRTVPGGGHAHAHVMVVAAAPSDEDERGERAAGASMLAELAGLVSGLGEGDRAPLYTTALLKCVPRDEDGPRDGLPEERERCFGYLSREISIITPHVLVPVGEDAAAYVLRRLLGERRDDRPVCLRVFETPAFRVATVPSPAELRAMPAGERKACVEQLRALAGRIHL
jgi:uracil-DNA glycosylase family 4